MARKALIVWGGWDGHVPDQIAALFEKLLKAEDFEVTVSDTLDAFVTEDLSTYHLIVPVWTMGNLTGEQESAVMTAVKNGVGMAGCHGGMGDAFRSACGWQFMTGGQFVGHPGNEIRYWVQMNRAIDHEITRGIDDFEVVSEQYYMHTDPGNQVLATTPFPTPGVSGEHDQNPCQMPVIWTRRWGQGRVFYSSLGHKLSDLEIPGAYETLRRGCLWAARA